MCSGKGSGYRMRKATSIIELSLSNPLGEKGITHGENVVLLRRDPMEFREIFSVFVSFVIFPYCAN